jgi:hypothetical protein
MKVNFQMLASLPNKFLRFQIEIERMFNLTNVLIAWKHCHLQVQNLDELLLSITITLMTCA